METTQKHLTWDSPEVRSLHNRYWAKHKRDFSPANFSHMREWPSDAPDPLMKYCIANGYLHTRPLNNEELLDNEIHPILAIENWLIESDISIDWFVHLRYGELSFNEAGQVYIRSMSADSSELSHLRATVRRDLRALAGKIRFTWLSSRTPGHEWLTGTAGVTKTSLSYMIKSYETDLNVASTQCLGSSVEASENGGTPTICFPIDMYYRTLASASNHFLYQSTLFRSYLGEAILLVHEITHAVGILWNKSDFDGTEALHSPSDTFPEFGVSWERHVFGGKLGCQPTGPAIAMTFEDNYPSDGQAASTPLVTFVKMEYVNQFFLKRTWEHLDKVREKLYAPTIVRSQEFFKLGRVVGGTYGPVIYIDENSVPDPHLYRRLQERGSVVVTWEHNQGRRYHLGEVVRWYRKIWKYEAAEAWATGSLPAPVASPHFYHHLTLAYEN